MEEVFEKHNLSAEAIKEILILVEESYPEKAKPLNVPTEEKFQEYLEELLKMIPETKMKESRQKVLTETCKFYMMENKLSIAECKYGKATLSEVFQRRLDRSLIPNIEEFKTLQKSNTFGKFPNKKAFDLML